MDHYVDDLRPFGHELVIDNPRNYPWNIYYENNKAIYSGVI